MLHVPPTSAAPLGIDRDASLLAVVTHRGGLAAGQAHNHLVTATGYRATLDFDPTDPLAARFELELAADDLAVDRSDLQQSWYPRLAELGVLDEPWREMSERDRAKVREAMLGRSQLDAARFPRISARVVGIDEKTTTVGGAAFDHEVVLALEAHGKTVEKPLAARYEIHEGALVVEAVGTFLFSDFAVKPYSAALGLVRNLDEFHVYLHLKTARDGRDEGR